MATLYKPSAILMILFSMISEEVYSSSVSLTVEGGVSLVGELCPGTVRLFCEGVDLTVLQWRLYYGDNYSSKKFVTDSVNSTKQVFNDSPLVSASVELVQVSQDRISKVFANFSSILTLELSQMAIDITRISCGDAVNNNDTSVNISIVEETLPNISNFSVIIDTSSNNAIDMLTVTWNQHVS